MSAPRSQAQRRGGRDGVSLLVLLALAIVLLPASCAMHDRELQLGELGSYNPSMAMFQGRALVAVRQTKFVNISGIGWSLNQALLCNMTLESLTADQAHTDECQPFDPWHGKYKECIR